MRSSYTAILHLHEQSPAPPWELLAMSLRRRPGVDQVICDPTDSLIVVRFDDDRASLAELVRHLEDGGVRVSGVAQRPRWPVSVTVAGSGATASRASGPAP